MKLYFKSYINIIVSPKTHDNLYVTILHGPSNDWVLQTVNQKFYLFQTNNSDECFGGVKMY